MHYNYRFLKIAALIGFLGTMLLKYPVLVNALDDEKYENVANETTGEDIKEFLLEIFEEVNPWTSVVSGYEIQEPSMVRTMDNSISYVTDVFSAANQLRENMILRNGKISIYYHGEYVEGMSKDILEAALEYDRSFPEYAGDYLRYHYNRVVRRTYKGTNEDGVYYRFEYEISYLSSYEQELAVELKIQEILDELDVYEADRETKIRSVYRYITENVSYDNMIYETYNVHSAYSAAVQRKAVCQGYSLLLYRMLHVLGIENRMIPGDAGGISHIWNIVEMDDLWYNMDATWDWGRTDDFEWFLKGSESFDGSHTRKDAFLTEEFGNQYPMSEKDYGYIEETEDKIEKDKETLFLERCYELILERRPDKMGLEYWKEKILKEQYETLDILLGFFNSIEYSSKKDALFQSDDILRRLFNDLEFVQNAPNEFEWDEAIFVYELYIEYLERHPDPIGFMDWYEKKVNDILTENQIREGFIYSVEYQTKRGINS